MNLFGRNNPSVGDMTLGLIGGWLLALVNRGGALDSGAEDPCLEARPG